MNGKISNDKNREKGNGFSGKISRKDNDGFHKKRHDNRRDGDAQKDVSLHAYKWQNFTEDESFEHQDREYMHVLTSRNRISI